MRGRVVDVIICVYFFKPPLLFYSLIIFTIFCQKTRNSLFPQCKTSIGNNSSSIKDRVVKFAYSMGLSAIAYRMVWPLFLSRDRKRPRPPVRCVTTSIDRTVGNGSVNVFQRQSRHFWSESKKNLIISTIFRKKKRKIPCSRNVKLQSAITPDL